MDRSIRKDKRLAEITAAHLAAAIENVKPLMDGSLHDKVLLLGLPVALEKAKRNCEACARVGDVAGVNRIAHWAGIMMDVVKTPRAKHGQNFIGRGGRATEALYLLTAEVLNELPEKSTWRQVLARMVEIDDGDVIQEIRYDEEKIYWRNGLSERKPTSFGRFKNLISEIRKLNKI